MNLCVENRRYKDALEARGKFVEYLKKNGEVDHQMRRAYLEMILLGMLKLGHGKIRGNYLIDEQLKEFMRGTPNAMAHDEYRIAEQLKEALVPETGGHEHADWKKVQEILKKPVFGFLNNEIVKRTKLLAMEMIEQEEEEAE